jgi:hypothetical protein
MIGTIFGMPVLRPDPPGAVFDLVDRTGYQLIETGHLVLANDGTYKLVYIGMGNVPTVRVEYGMLQQQSASVYMLDNGDTFLVSGDHATLSYNTAINSADEPNVIAHVVEDYTRRR